MSRRQSDFERFLDELLVFLRVVPWWVGPPLILLTWLLFAFAVPGVLSFFGGEDAHLSLQTFLRVFVTVSGGLAPWLACLVAVVWLLALVKKIGNAQRLDRQTSITSIRDLSWHDFEQLLAEAFRRQGYRVRDTGPGADGGVDLILDKDGRQTLVQAKQWKAGKVGVKVVRELLGVQTAQQADASVLVTSGHFTEEARRFAAANGVKLIDGATLAQMIAAVQRSPRVEPRRGGQAAAVQAAVPPGCPTCGAAMVRRKARRGANAGRSFWGCPQFPTCKGVRPIT